MHDIGELQRRIISALDRIGTGVDGLVVSQTQDDAAQPSAEVEALKAELARERETVADMRGRIAELEAEATDADGGLRGELTEAQTLLSALEEDRNRLKAANEALTEATRSLRQANAEGLSDHALVNAAAATEVETLKTLRDSDRTELDALMRMIEPVVSMEKEAKDA